MKPLSFRLWGQTALISSLLLAGFAPRAHATEYFGQRGQFFLGGGSSLNAMTWKHNKYKDVGSRNDLSFGLAPQFGVFVARNFFVGADLAFEANVPGKSPGDVRDLAKEVLDKEVTNNSLQLKAGPRVGFNIDFGRGVSLMPSLGLGYKLKRAAQTNKHGISADVKVPFVFQIAQHGALLIGPEGSYSTTGDELHDPLPAFFRVGLGGGLLIWI